MRRPMAKKVLAATMAAAMTMSVAACDSKTSTTTSTSTPASTSTSTEVSTPEEEVSKYTIIKDKDGNVVDLGGMTVTIRDWWSGDGVDWTDTKSKYEEDRQEYREWAQQTYNFKIEQVGISDWGKAPSDFADYVTTGGDDSNYIFIVRNAAAFSSAVNAGQAANLSKLTDTDFSVAKYTRNTVAATWTISGDVYAFNTGYSEPRTGLYFNKRVLEEAKVDWQTDIYDAQKNGTWDWDAFAKIMEKVHRDTNNDGEVDVYGLCANEGVMTTAAVFSNGGAYIDRNADGSFRYALEDENTMQALNWCVDMYNKYDNHDPAGAEWNYYMEEFKSGVVAFLPDDCYCGYPNGYLLEMEDADQIGFVMFPKGPSADAKYTNVYSDNIYVIPACYSDEKVWKLMFAFDVWSNEPAGYEDQNAFLDNCQNGLFDEEAINQIAQMMTPAHSSVDLSTTLPNLDLGPDLTWGVGVGTDVTAKVEEVGSKWKAYIDDANAKAGK